MKASHSNPYESPSDTGGRRGFMFGPQPESFLGSITQGIRLGVKWATLILGPVAVLMFLIGIGLSAYRIFFQEGARMLTDPDMRWEMLKGLATPLGFYLVSCMWGIVGGVLICPMVYLIRRTRGALTQADEPVVGEPAMQSPVAEKERAL